MLRFLKREYVELYPDLEVFADATRARDWPRLRQLIEALPSGADACVPLMIATEVRGSERFLAEVLRAEPDSVPARVLLGSRLIIQAWEARTAYSASSASNAQAEVFHERLRRADEVLAEAVELDPANPAAWSFRVTTARGLGLGLAEARYRYQQVAPSGPHHFYAQQSMLQQLCPKWGGDLDAMHAFAREAMIAAGPGGLSGALVPAGMIEHLLTLNKPAQLAYLRSSHVVPQLEAAATWSVMNPNFGQSPGWLWAHNVFAYMWVAVGLPARGKVHFDIADRRAGTYPWDALPDPHESYLSIRKRAMAAWFCFWRRGHGGEPVRGRWHGRLGRVSTPESQARAAVEAAWRIESPRLIAGLVRIVNDIGFAEEVAQDALVAALEQWPVSGVPRNPGAWLMTVAKRRLIDVLRRQNTFDDKVALLLRDLETGSVADSAAEGDPDRIEDDLLRLVFVSCHPVLSPDARVAMTLRLIGGLSTDEIARAFLVPEPTVAKRIVRAKKAIADAGVPFEVPDGPDRAERLESVLEVIYLVFNEGYSATAGDDWMRPELCAEALRLGRILTRLVPNDPEVHGLVALMEIQASRSAARSDESGAPVRLLDQDRSRWNHLLIRRGMAALARAQELGGGDRPYALQAAIAAEHGRALRAEDTDWVRIATLYERLALESGSPVVELNRAVALSMAYGPQAGLDLVDQITDDPALQDYHLVPSVRGDLLWKLGRTDEARAEFERAAAMTRNAAEQQLLLDRAAAAHQ